MKYITNKYKRKALAIFLLSTIIPLSGAKDRSSDFVVDTYTENDVNFDDSFNVNDLDSYVLQGICILDNFKLITAYDSNGDKNSIVYIYDNDNYLGYTSLYNKAHVGGIAYDIDHEMIWITDIDGTISGYKKNDILSLCNNIEPEYMQIDIGDNLTNNNGNNAAAYITIDGDKLYVGNYSELGTAIVKEIRIRWDGSLALNSMVERKFPKYVQGMTFYTYNNTKYLLLSTSWGTILNSEIRIYKYDENIVDYNNVNYISIDLPPMIEQVTVDNNNDILSVFESNSYFTPTYKLDDVYTLSLDNVLNNSSNKL